MDVLYECEAVYKGMEFFGARSSTTLDTCLAQISEADRVIVLIGTRYGSRPDTASPSFTEIEIHEAERLNRPILVYFLDIDQHPVLAKHVDSGRDGEDLLALKDRLRRKYTIGSFTTPDDLGRCLARDLLREERQVLSRHADTAKRYRETAYDVLAEWYDLWYKDHWKSEEPYRTIVAIAKACFEAFRGNISHLKVLDCACGTGNAFCSFVRNGFDVCGTDGSREMLARARNNCESQGIDTKDLILEPMNWTDSAAFIERFGAESFDLIVNTANSFCHIPPTHGYMHRALSTFHQLLRPGGILVIDTKRYVRSDDRNGVPTYHELRYIAEANEWIVRSERRESVATADLGVVNFHTRLLYDDDPSFGPPVRRALIVVTIYGEAVTPRTLVIPYYPLPARDLSTRMQEAGFTASVTPAYERLAVNWKYDIVVARKPRS
jgi:SAM-dependent methyltransferase